MGHTWINRELSDKQIVLYNRLIDTNSSDIQFILDKVKELNRKSMPEYRFEEEFKENIHLYEKTIIDHGTGI